MLDKPKVDLFGFVPGVVNTNRLLLFNLSIIDADFFSFVFLGTENISVYPYL